MSDDAPIIEPTIETDKHTENSHGHSAHHEKKSHSKQLPRTSTAGSGLISVIYEAPTGDEDTGITFAPPPSANYNYQQSRRSTGTGPTERQLSVLDPMSDRVSTILVWKDLVVFTREDKKKQYIQRLTRKNAEPTTKRLLHNVSGAITGGLWAVMGK